MDNAESVLNKKEPQQKRSMETRAKLISAAVELFNEKGFYDTTTKDISKRAGVSVGIFYNYFDDKSKIYYESIKLNCDIGNSDLLKLAEESFKDGLSKEKVYGYFYSALQRIRPRIKTISERDKIRKDYPEIDQLIREREQESAKIISEYLSIDHPEIAGKLVVETSNRNCIVIADMEDPKEQEQYIKHLSDMIYYFCEKYLKKLS